jgi:hypothetical protein
MYSYLKALVLGIALLLSPIPLITIVTASVIVFTLIWFIHALLTAAFKAGA